MEKTKIFKERLEQEYEKIENSISKPNILLAGGTGIGKSSLINLIFGEELAEVGVGEPVTDSINIYKKPDTSVVLYDTAGYEIGSEKQKKFLNEVVNFAIDNNESAEHQIHLVWYCIDASGHRVTDLDISIIQKIYNANIPIGVVFTKCDLVSIDEICKLEETLHTELPNLTIFRLTTLDIPELNYLDLDKLISWSINRLPKGLKMGFIKAQKANLEENKKSANKAIKQHVASSGLIGMTPIPFSDAPILITNQASMFARVLNIYDMKYMLKDFKFLAGGLGIKKIISSSGIWIAGQLAKLFPGAGTIVGGIISGSVAVGVTTALGYATSEMCYKISKSAIKGEEEEVKQLLNNFKPIMKDLFKKYHEESLAIDVDDKTI